MCPVSDQLVAVKIIKRSVNTEQDGNHREEQMFLRTLHHRNIAMFHGFGEKHGMPVIVTEFASRGSLRNVLSEDTNCLSRPQRRSFMLDAATGIAFLHAQDPPLPHLNLKSDNLLLTDNWVVKVAGFGTTTKRRQSVQRMLWLAPEVLMGTAGCAECPVDV